MIKHFSKKGDAQLQNKSVSASEQEKVWEFLAKIFSQQHYFK